MLLLWIRHKPVKELLQVPDGYSVLFLQGGASTQFLMTAMNLLKTSGKAAYINTGTWSTKAIKEAKDMVRLILSQALKIKTSLIFQKIIVLQKIQTICTSHQITRSLEPNYEFPKVSKDTMLVCDMSSDIFSRKIDVSKFDLIYAGAQKIWVLQNYFGIIKDEILKKTGRDIPTMLDYSTHISKGSMFNTPPVFPIYVSMLTLEWLKNNGGVDNIENLNNAKAQLLYSEIDNLFKGVAAVEDRSKMNVTFVLTDESNKKHLINWNDAGINGLKGHRSVGGYRASYTMHYQLKVYKY